MSDAKLYKVWQVYEPGKIWHVKWYVVNQVTRKVQSVWDSFDDAKRTSRDLNAWSLRTAKNIRKLGNG